MNKTIEKGAKYADPKHHIYIIATPDSSTRKIKVGRTSDVRKRISSISLTSGSRILLFAIITFQDQFLASAAEKNCHLILSTNGFPRIGEWFLGATVKDAIMQICPSYGHLWQYDDIPNDLEDAIGIVEATPYAKFFIGSDAYDLKASEDGKSLELIT